MKSRGQGLFLLKGRERSRESRSEHLKQKTDSTSSRALPKASPKHRGLPASPRRKHSSSERGRIKASPQGFTERSTIHPGEKAIMLTPPHTEGQRSTRSETKDQQGSNVFSAGIKALRDTRPGHLKSQHPCFPTYPPTVHQKPPLPCEFLFQFSPALPSCIISCLLYKQSDRKYL